MWAAVDGDDRTLGRAQKRVVNTLHGSSISFRNAAGADGNL
jgi:hypothetical protein